MIRDAAQSCCIDVRVHMTYFCMFNLLHMRVSYFTPIYKAEQCWHILAAIYTE